MKELSIRAFNIYKYSAKKRNLEFSVSLEQFTQLVKGKCYYCGFEPRKYQDSIRNGVDRIDSKIGYNRDNVISCCSVCNKMKGSLSHDSFFDKIKAIYEENEKYKKLDAEEKLVFHIKSGVPVNPRNVLEYIKNGMLKEEDLHYDYLDTLDSFESEKKMIKDALIKVIRLLNIGLNNYIVKIENMSREDLTFFYKEAVLHNYVNVRKLVKVLGGNYKKIDPKLKPILQFL